MSVSLSEEVVVAQLRAAGCVFAEDEARLLMAAADTPAALAALVAQRVAGLPLEHVLGWVEFCGLRIAVDPGVFVPRQRTSFLVEQAVSLSPSVVLDLCCGCGALGVAVASAVGGVELHASDIDPVAVACARRNVVGSVYVGDLYAPLPVGLMGRVDVLLANVPYVPTRHIELLPAEARLYEPLVALDGGLDGFSVLRRVVASAGSWLTRGGSLLFEVSSGQASSAVRLVSGYGFSCRVVVSADLGATVVVASL